MASGFQSWNEGGFLQFDSNRRSLRLLSKWTVNSYYSSQFFDLSSQAFQEAQVSFQSSIPMVAVYCAYPISFIDTIYSGVSPFDATFRFFVQAYAPVPVTFYAFGPPAASGGNYGMQTFDGSGNLIFDATNSPLRVTGQIISPGAASTYTYASGRSYAMVLSEFIGFVLAPNTFPLDPLDFYTRFARVSGSSIITNELKHYANPPWSIVANQLYDNRAGRILVVDVTGF